MSGCDSMLSVFAVVFILKLYLSDNAKWGFAVSTSNVGLYLNRKEYFCTKSTLLCFSPY